ncbi:hypothetical protein ACFXKY_15735 [Streptomyces canus]|uniref:hypothetical protein n=1 Tax=Streptomyces canus TaxID=58343 RepID=UPI0036CE0B0A
MSIRKVADVVGYSPSYVRELLVDVAGIQLRDQQGRPPKKSVVRLVAARKRRPQTKALAWKCADLYQQRHLSIRSVSAWVGYSPSYVRELLIDVAGVELRDRYRRPRKAVA